MSATRSLQEEARKLGEADALLWGQLGPTVGDEAMVQFLRRQPRELHRALGLEVPLSVPTTQSLLDAWRDSFMETLEWLGTG